MSKCTRKKTSQSVQCRDGRCPVLQKLKFTKKISMKAFTTRSLSAQFRLAAASLWCAFAAFSASAADTPAPAMSAKDLAARLAALQQDGASYVRLRLDATGATKIALQIQIKQRRTKTASEIIYQILWPKERKGEGVLLRKIGDRPATGTIFRPPDTVRALDADQMKEPLFGSDLTCEDIIENFFTWDNQAIVGAETVDRVNCQVLESKPGKGQRFSYASVRTWVDTRRTVPMRVEKYSASGELLRRIDSTRIVSEDHRHIPANLSVSGRRKDSITELDGSRIVHDVAFTDRDFTPDALRELTTPKSAPK